MSSEVTTTNKKRTVSSNGDNANDASANQESLQQDASLQDLIDAELNSRLCGLTNSTEDVDNLVQPETMETVEIIDSSPVNQKVTEENLDVDILNVEQDIESSSQNSVIENHENSSEDAIASSLTEDNSTDMRNDKLDTLAFLESEILHSSENVSVDNLDIMMESSNLNPELQLNDKIIIDPFTDRIEDNDELFTDTVEESLEASDRSEVDNFAGKSPSIKDKMMQGSDEQMCLLFSQTITSPAMTPTDENFDILQAIKSKSDSIEEFIQNEQMILAQEESFEDNVSEPNVENGDVFEQKTEGGSLEEKSDILDEVTEGSFEYIDNDKVDVNIVEQVNVNLETPANIETENAELQIEEEHAVEDRENGEIRPETLVEDGNYTCTIQNDKKICTNLETGETIEKKSKNEMTNGNAEEDIESYRISQNRFLIDDRNKQDYVINNNEQVVSNTTSTTETSLSETIETTANNMSSTETKTVKKKKSKKSKKDHEKENISVDEKTELIIEDDLSQVNVKNLKQTIYEQSINIVKKSEPKISTGVSIKQLCRSFGDLTSISDDNTAQNTIQKTQVSPLSQNTSPDSRTKSMTDLRRLDLEPVFTGVSVKALRASFLNLASNSNNGGDDSNGRSRPVFRVGSLTRPMRSLSQPARKSSFSKFDALQKKTVLHVRSSDSGKAQEKFNGLNQLEQTCKSCSKQVFQMEQIKAEKAIWHKNCFRCKECNKQVTVDTYQSHEGELYCKPHFKALFAPKVVEETQPTKPRKHELIIRESQPIELPPDVVRASDKPDLGLEELQSLNVKSRFQVFEHSKEQDVEHQLERSASGVGVKRSASILSKLARFQAKGMDIGVTDDSLNGIPVEESSESEESEEEIEGEDAELVRAKRAQREKPFVFEKMNDVKSKWEQGHQMSKEERREERKQEIQSIRSRLFMGKQGKMKEMYQQAVAESESGAHVKKQLPSDSEINEKAKLIKEKFEKGEVIRDDEEKHEKNNEDSEVFESAISKKSKQLFRELDATAASKPVQVAPLSPVKPLGTDVKRTREALTRHISEDIVRSSDAVEDVHVETADICSRFKFFETYKAPETGRKEFRITPPRDGVVKTGSPEREIYRDPEVVRSEEAVEDSTIAEKTHTASKMLSLFRQLEEQSTQEPAPKGPKPLKRFTPPPEPVRGDSDSEEEGSSEDVTDSESETEPPLDSNIVRSSDKQTDEFLIKAREAARAKQLMAKFERWEEREIQREQNNSSINLAEECSEEQIESAKALRAKFEQMKGGANDKNDKPRVKVNRFVEFQANNIAEYCDVCEKRVYPLEKVECNTKVYHKQCFRCLQCNTILRMDSYTLNQGMLYCIPHFKQLFITKGNYETGFGLNQHKAKWEQLNNTV